MNIDEQLIYYFQNKPGDIEECALVVENHDGFQRIFPCRNISQSPTDSFLISPNEVVRASMNKKIIAMAHSHIDGSGTLSAADRINQHCNRYEWILYANGELSHYQPLKRFKGRKFKEGFIDCYDVMKDFYYLCGLDMKNYGPDEGFRIPDWHRKPGATSPFIENMESEGFIEVEKMEDLQPGDVILSLLGSNIPNHCLVYFGDNRVFHHLPERLSGEETLRDFFVKMKHSIWRHKESDNLPIEQVIELIRREPIL